jgi:hypothetical protein
MAIRFDANTDRLMTDGWGGTVATILCWWQLGASAGSQSVYHVTPSANGAGGTRLLLQTSAGTTMVLYDQSLSETQAAGNPGEDTWYCHALVMDGNNFTVYHGSSPESLSTVGPTTRQGFTAPGSLAIGAATVSGNPVEGLQGGDIANLKVWTRALSLSDVQAELATYDVVNATNLVRKHSFRTTSLANEQGSGAAFTAGSTAVALVAGPSALIDITGAFAGTAPSPVSGALAAEIGTTGQLAGITPLPSASLAADVHIGAQLAGTVALPFGTLAEVLPLTTRPRVGTATLETVASGWRVGDVELET